MRAQPGKRHSVGVTMPHPRAMLLLLVSSLIALDARATLVELDDPQFGPASITRDTEQGLDWLDVPISAGRSYNDVSTQFGVGGDFEGFRYATKDEVRDLLIAVGVTAIDASGNHESYA